MKTFSESLFLRLLPKSPLHVASGKNPGLRLFLFTLAGLAFALCLTFYATFMSESGRFRLAALLAALALLLAGMVGIKVMPTLVRRSALKAWAFRVEYELTREGTVYFLLIGLLTIAALNTGNNLLFMILAVLLAGLLMSGLISRVILSGLELKLKLPDHVFAWQPVRARLTIENHKAFFPSYSVTVFSLATKVKILPKAVPEKSQPLPPHILVRPVYAPYVPRRSSVTESVFLRFPRRGLYRQKNLQVSSKFPFGILRRKRALPGDYEILALPSVEPTHRFQDVAPLILGEMESAQKGRDGDFFALRDYQEGDSARHVDWKATAKAQKLQVREFTREEDSRVTLLFDSRVSGIDARTLEQFEKAVSLCACLAWRFFEIRSLLQLITADQEIPIAPADEVIYPILEALAVIEPQDVAGVKDTGRKTGSGAEAAGFPIFFLDRRVATVPPGFEGKGHLIALETL